MKYGIVCCEVWDHPQFKELSSKGMLALIYLWTHQNRNSCGIYRSSVVAIGDLCPRPIEEFVEGIAEAEKAGFIFLDHRHKVILLHSYVKYCHPGNLNIMKSWGSVLKTIPDESPLKKQWYEETLKGLKQGFSELFMELFSNCSGGCHENDSIVPAAEASGPQEGQPEADAEAPRQPETPKPPKAKITKMTDEEFIAALKANTAYRTLDIDHELSLMDTWLLANPGRKKTPKFIVGWLNRNIRERREIAPPQQGGQPQAKKFSAQGQKNAALAQSMMERRRQQQSNGGEGTGNEGT